MEKEFKKSTARFECYENDNNKQDLFITTEEFTISDVLGSGVPIKDKAWFIRRNCEMSTDELRQYAIGCALCVLPIYESKYPDNKAPREAIQAAKEYLLGSINLEDLQTKKRAAAYAADAAAYAAAYAADAAADYAAADAKTSYKDLLLQFMVEFTK